MSFPRFPFRGPGNFGDENKVLNLIHYQSERIPAFENSCQEFWFVRFWKF
jgi:hypothetical protein